MDVLEKLYFFEDEPVLSARSKKLEGADIEYVRIDAFIEKAEKWFEMQNEWVDLDGNYKCDMNDFEDFRNYMKGE